MNVSTKYNIDDYVLFVLSDRTQETGNINIFYGYIKQIEILKTDRHLNIHYRIKQTKSSNEYTINEKYLFKDVKEIFKFFNQNARNFLNVDKQAFKLNDSLTAGINIDTLNDDDLPF